MINILKDEEFRAAVLSAIQGATGEILMTTYKMDYRESPKIPHLNALVEALERARKRGVKVHILLNMDNPRGKLGMINREAKKALVCKGVDVRLTPEGRSSHAKLIIIDNRVAFVGSHNLSESSLCRNFEVSLMLTQEWPAVPGVWEVLQVVRVLRNIFLKEWGKGR